MTDETDEQKALRAREEVAQRLNKSLDELNRFIAWARTEFDDETLDTLQDVAHVMRTKRPAPGMEEALKAEREARERAEQAVHFVEQRFADVFADVEQMRSESVPAGSDFGNSTVATLALRVLHTLDPNREADAALFKKLPPTPSTVKAERDAGDAELKRVKERAEALENRVNESEARRVSDKSRLSRQLALEWEARERAERQLRILSETRQGVINGADRVIAERDAANDLLRRAAEMAICIFDVPPPRECKCRACTLRDAIAAHLKGGDRPDQRGADSLSTPESVTEPGAEQGSGLSSPHVYMRCSACNTVGQIQPRLCPNCQRAGTFVPVVEALAAQPKREEHPDTARLALNAAVIHLRNLVDAMDPNTGPHRNQQMEWADAKAFVVAIDRAREAEHGRP